MDFFYLLKFHDLTPLVLRCLISTHNYLINTFIYFHLWFYATFAQGDWSETVLKDADTEQEHIVLNEMQS